MLNTTSQQDTIMRLAEFIANGKPLLVLTGAGISAPSGIPEYRDKNGNWKHSKPVQYQEFISSQKTYRRYWARSTVGWQNMGYAKPNPAHLALVELEKRHLVDCVITQNVDRLHEHAGQQNVVNLHGQLHSASCQQCDYRVERNELQKTIEKANSDWIKKHITINYQQKPDGDADINEQNYVDFTPPFCPACESKIKPDVVFFGENIPASTNQLAREAQAKSKSLLVIGSSLMVFSGYRITREFHRRGLPIALVNKGKTRADDFISDNYVADASQLLPRVIEAL